MADDTVEEARQTVLHEALDYVDSRETFQRKVDALIAAVRAEKGVERFVDGILDAAEDRMAKRIEPLAEQTYWRRSLELVADELERLTPEQLDARRAKLIAVIRVAAARFTR